MSVGYDSVGVLAVGIGFVASVDAGLILALELPFRLDASAGSLVTSATVCSIFSSCACSRDWISRRPNSTTAAPAASPAAAAAATHRHVWVRRPDSASRAAVLRRYASSRAARPRLRALSPRLRTSLDRKSVV